MANNSSSLGVMMLPEAERLDETNWFAWKIKILTATSVRLSGYLDGTTKKPISTSPVITVTPPAAPGSPEPVRTQAPVELSKEEHEALEDWRLKDAQAMAHIVLNTRDVVGMGIDTSGTAAAAWKSLVDTQEDRSWLSVITASAKLRKLKLTEGSDLNVHITELRRRRAAANAVGANILEGEFCMIILQSLP